MTFLHLPPLLRILILPFCMSLLLCFPYCSFAGAPVFHVVVAEKWLEVFENYDESQKQAFFLGNLFPDIRYSARLPRSTTHSYRHSIAEILAIQDPFLKGVMVHSFADEARERFLQTHSITSLIQQIPGNRSLYLKILEDDVIYKRKPTNDTRLICNYLNTIEPQECSHGWNIPLPVVEAWHKALQEYFSLSPKTFISKHVSCKQQSCLVPQTCIVGILKTLNRYGEDQRVAQYINELLLHFDILFASEYTHCLQTHLSD